MALGGPAAAHATIAQREHTPGSFTVLTFAVGHGCHRWAQIPEEGQDAFELDEPAPFIAVSAGGEDGHGHDDGEEVDEAEATDEDQASPVTDTDDDGSTELATDLAADTGGTDALTVVALLVGLASVGVGTAGFLTARRATHST